MQKYILIYLLFLLVTSCEGQVRGIELSIGNEIQVSSEQKPSALLFGVVQTGHLPAQPLGAGQARSVRHKEIHL